jgi:hypothetical protein
VSDAIDLAEMVSEPSDAAAQLHAIFWRDAELFRVISQHGIRPVVFVGFDAPADTRNETRKQTDAALLAAIGRIQTAGR